MLAEEMVLPSLVSVVNMITHHPITNLLCTLQTNKSVHFLNGTLHFSHPVLLITVVPTSETSSYSF